MLYSVEDDWIEMSSFPIIKAQTQLLLRSKQSLASFVFNAEGTIIEYLKFSKPLEEKDFRLTAEIALSSYAGELYHLAIIPRFRYT